jgi:hypothetical protein
VLEGHPTKGAAVRPLKAIVVLALLVLLVSSLTGCSFAAQKIAETATGVKVDQSGNSVTVTGKNGTASVTSKEGRLPDGLPGDVPAYAGTIKSSATLATDQGTNYTFQVDTPDSIATVQSWYKDKLASNGWTVTGTVTGGTDSAMVSAKKGDKSNLVVTIGKNSTSGQTEIAVIADVKK